jgi:hypothetical protein
VTAGFSCILGPTPALGAVVLVSRQTVSLTTRLKSRMGTWDHREHFAYAWVVICRNLKVHRHVNVNEGTKSHSLRVMLSRLHLLSTDQPSISGLVRRMRAGVRI